jgi:sensor domain CHASE-containing protein
MAARAAAAILRNMAAMPAVVAGGFRQLHTRTLVDRVVWDYQGNVYAPAALLADVDRDGVRRMRLAVGRGHLADQQRTVFAHPTDACTH